MGSHPRRVKSEFKAAAFSDATAVHDSADSVIFSMFSKDEIKTLSACAVTNPNMFNQLGHPLPGGLYDLRMGPYSDKNDMVCSTCLLHCEHCPGHIGHIDLPLPVCNPLFHQTILQILKLSCMTCGRFRMPEYLKKLFLVQQKLLERGLIIEAQQVADFTANDDDSVYEVDGDEVKRSRVKKTEKPGLVYKLEEFYRDIINREDLEATKKHNSDTRVVEGLIKSFRKAFMDSAQKGQGKCIHSDCMGKTKRIVLFKSSVIYEGTDLDETPDLSKPSLSKVHVKGYRQIELLPTKIQDMFRKLWHADAEVLIYLFPMLKNVDTAHPTDVFFIETLAVPPPKVRPCQFTGGLMTVHPQSQGLNFVVETVTVMRQILRLKQSKDDVESLNPQTIEMIQTMRGADLDAKLLFNWKELQSNVDHVLDKEIKSGTGNKVGWGFKQLIERKQGLFRMHMMGKRVNFAARTVITPDPNICIDEIGLPEVFAKSLTYRESVTPFNVETLREMVLNGPDIHPGATAIEDENGFRRMLDANNPVQREALAKTLMTPGAEDAGSKFVHRHLITGDAMLLNRQPTLHKPSIMSHRARVLKGEKVMRLHYAICKSYNADFDGDEMNAHFPQNEVARSEAYNIVNVCKQYLVPKDGTPLQGLIQDHIIAGVKMTVRGRFFNREQYQKFVFGALVDFRGRIKTLPPAIIKPEPLWSGKQIISTIIMNLVPKDKEPPTMDSSAKVKAQEWQKEKFRISLAGGQIPQKKQPWNTTMCESEVIFRQGEFLSGVLDKNQYGATNYSLVHAFYELYGGTYSGKLLSAFSKVFTIFLRTEGFTLGVHDIVVLEKANKKRKKIIKATRKQGPLLAANGVELTSEDGVINEDELKERMEQYHRASRKIPKKRMDIDRAYKDVLAPVTNDINSTCLPKGLVKKFPNNNLQLMVQAGAKGSSVNTMQISCLLGQIELEGKRPPLMISGKSLPSFVPYDPQPRAGGFIDGRFMSGIRPQEFFFHCMAGREGLIDTAVKTSRSGYLQRCLIKLLEGLVVNYDLTVRDSDGSVVQFMYGEDSMDVCKSRYLNTKQLDFLYDNKASVVDKRSVELAKRHHNDKAIKKYKKSLKKWKKSKSGIDGRDGGFLRFWHERMSEIKVKMDESADLKKQLVTEWHNLATSEDESERLYRARMEQANQRYPDPIVSTHRPDSNFASVSEAIETMMENYVSAADQKKNFDPDEFKEMVYLKSMQSMVDPGEPVGVLAAQSVGEPSTQMTLNTFHFAGRGDMNVTLGIPRLREILMVASENIKTPSMTIPFLPNINGKEREALRLKLNRIVLADVIEAVHVSEKIQLQGQRMRVVSLRFHFLPKKCYRDKFATNSKTILAYFEKKFVSKVLCPTILAGSKEKKVVVEKRGESRPVSRASGMFDESKDDKDKEMEQMEKAGVGEGHASSDEEELPDDADATQSRKQNRQKDEDFDEGLSDEEVEMMNELSKKLDGVNDDSNMTDGGFDEDISADEDQDDTKNEVEQEESKQNQSWEESLLMENDPNAQKRKLNVLNSITSKARINLLDYSYDTNKELWCQLTLGFPLAQRIVDMTNIVKKAAEKAVIAEVPKIKRAFLIQNESGEEVLTTEGANIEAMFQFDQILDLKRLSCNNIHDMARYYGIEAANRTIVREIVNVFKAYAIDVNKRHLTLIADYMTYEGRYKPFNRIGIENNPSPLQQMTFETAIGFLRNATLGGKRDNLSSPSSCIVVGKPCFGGTSSFSVVQNLLAHSVKENKFH